MYRMWCVACFAVRGVPWQLVINAPVSVDTQIADQNSGINGVGGAEFMDTLMGIQGSDPRVLLSSHVLRSRR
jgi:hypothetical protein